MQKQKEVKPKPKKIKTDFDPIEYKRRPQSILTPEDEDGKAKDPMDTYFMSVTCMSI